jgi:Holliday junction resolvase
VTRRGGKLMPDAQALADASMTPEAAFQVQVVRLLKLRGWRTFHVYDSRRSEAGFPDLIALRGQRCLALELKSLRGRATPAQLEWLVAFREVTQVDAHVVRPPRDGDWSELEELVR